MTNIITSDITSEMKSAYLDYAMSVIVSRALPDVRDGLKPVHRRVLYAMWRIGLTSSARFSKSATVVGEVLGKYHPHGDSPVYEALVRMAQEFSLRYPLVRGQGNFGSIDGDPPAAMRYTEVKLAKIAEEMLTDLDKDTIDWMDNFDARHKEPEFLPAKLPNVLLMGAEGIAVGMATKIPPHNLTEICNGIMAMIESSTLNSDTKAVGENIETSSEPSTKKEVVQELTLDTNTLSVTGTPKAQTQEKLLNFNIELEELLTHIKGPDFPTGANMYGWEEIKLAYATGRGRVLMRATVAHEEVSKNKEAIIISALPYQVNKADLVAKIAFLVNEKKLNGISDLRDESDKDGIRVVIELKKDASYKQVVNNLFKHTEMQSSFPINMVVLVDKTPQTLGLKSILEYYLRHRISVIIRRSLFELKAAMHRAHILEGLLKALDVIDEVINIIRSSKNESIAKEQLVSKLGFSALQAQAILDMQLKRLTALERDKLVDELNALKKIIEYLQKLLSDVQLILTVIKEELLELVKNFGDERRTILHHSRPGDFTDEQLIENKQVLVTLTNDGYIKALPGDTFRMQHRGGKGVTGMETKEDDDVAYITSCQTHDSVLFFTNLGRVYQTRAWEIPLTSRVAKGKAIVNLISLTGGESITNMLAYSKNDIDANTNNYILMCTRQGTIKKTPLADFRNIRNNGIKAINLDESDQLLWTMLTDGNQKIICASLLGQAIVFKESDVRPTGRSSAGVRAMRLDKGDHLTSVDVSALDSDKNLLVIAQKGIGKKTALRLFPVQGRGGKGVKIATLDEKTGKTAFSKVIQDEEALVITTKKGQVIKLDLAQVPTLSRVAKGVILMRFSETGDTVASATLI